MKPLFYVIICLIFCSCTKKYYPFFSPSQQTFISGSKKSNKREETTNDAFQKPDTLIATASLEKSFIPIVKERYDRSRFFGKISQTGKKDTLVLRNGKVLLGKIVGKSDVLYAYTEEKTNANKVIKKREVQEIRYSDGTIFYNKELDPHLILAFVLLFVLPLESLAFRIAYKSLERIQNAPNKYVGKIFAYVIMACAIVIPLIILSLLIYWLATFSLPSPRFP